MPDARDRQGRNSSQRFALIVAGVFLLLAIVVWGPWNGSHVESNPGPSGTPGSTEAHQTPPPAAGPSGGATTGTAH